MRLEEFPEIKEGIIAEIEYFERELGFLRTSDGPLFQTFYVEGIVFISRRVGPTMSIAPFPDGRTICKTMPTDSQSYPFLEVYKQRYDDHATKRPFHLRPKYIYLDDIVSFRPL